MPKPRQVATQDEFTGGLNLRANQFQLKANESPSMFNMDIDPRGGVSLRKGAKLWADNVADTVHSIGQFRTAATSQVIVGAALKVRYTTGTSWTNIVTNNTVTDPLSMVQFKDNLYIQNGTDQPIRWTGSAATRLTQTYAEDFDVPGSGKMPVGRIVTAHNGHIFVASTLESGTRHLNRIRWSHPNQPESWRAADYIDIDTGVDGDEIVGLVPYMDHLLVLKRRSTHVLFGFDWTSFSVQKVSGDVGCSAMGAACSTPTGVYLWSPDTGVWRYNGRGIEYVFSSLWPSVDDGVIDPGRQDEVRLGWLDNRVWVSIPLVGGLSGVYVLDPTITREGSWTFYGLPVGSMLAFGPDDTPSTPLAIYKGTSRLLQLEVEGRSYDEFAAGVPTHIDSWYTTPWFDMDQPAAVKVFHSPQFVFHGSGNDRARIEVFRDYDSERYAKWFTEPVSGSSGSMVWGTSTWGAPTKWGGTGNEHIVKKGSPLGRARSVQLKILGPESNIDWGLDAISLVYTPRRVR